MQICSLPRTDISIKSVQKIRIMQLHSRNFFILCFGFKNMTYKLQLLLPVIGFAFLIGMNSILVCNKFSTGCLLMFCSLNPFIQYIQNGRDSNRWKCIFWFVREKKWWITFLFAKRKCKQQPATKENTWNY